MIDNIFTALTHEKTTGAILEFILWCTVCSAALLSLIALAMGGGEITWILLMLFSAGLAVLMAFRLKAIALLYSVGVFYLLAFFIHYFRFSFGYSYGASHSPINILLFVLTLMLSLAIVICAFIHFFSNANLGTVLTILVLCGSGAVFLLQALMYASEYIGEISYINSDHRAWMNYRGYWIGTVAFWMLLAVVATFYVCFFWGPIDSRRGKIIGSGRSAAGRAVAATYGLQGICGVYAGRAISLQGRTITIGSGETAHVVLPDAYVSKIHCAIRFNAITGFYEIMDQSANGVWLANGTRLQKNIYHAVQRGSVICIGSAAQQFQLL